MAKINVQVLIDRMEELFGFDADENDTCSFCDEIQGLVSVSIQEAERLIAAAKKFLIPITEGMSPDGIECVQKAMQHLQTLSRAARN